jgi:hypothetical protein
MLGFKYPIMQLATKSVRAFVFSNFVVFRAVLTVAGIAAVALGM